MIFFNRGGMPFPPYLKIEYSITGREGPWISIVDSVASGLFNWRVPVYDRDYRNCCYIKVSDPVGGYAYAMNPVPFTIRNPESVAEFAPSSNTLSSASPNPFNSTIMIDLSEDFTKSLDIYDLNGKLVRTIMVNGSNSVIWDGRDQSGIDLDSGIYLALSGHGKKPLKLMLIR
jgi:hypothetical protein